MIEIMLFLKHSNEKKKMKVQELCSENGRPLPVFSTSRAVVKYLQTSRHMVQQCKLTAGENRVQHICCKTDVLSTEAAFCACTITVSILFFAFSGFCFECIVTICIVTVCIVTVCSAFLPFFALRNLYIVYLIFFFFYNSPSP